MSSDDSLKAENVYLKKQLNQLRQVVKSLTDVVESMNCQLAKDFPKVASDSEDSDEQNEQNEQNVICEKDSSDSEKM